jgi:pimeloyl-ACP methyl ester carboxylesterase
VSLPGAAGPWRRERSVTVGPVTMALTETAGPGDRVFVLVHGIGMGRAVFDDLAAALAARGRVLAFDLPGFGDSPEPGTAMSLETTAAVVADAVAQQVPDGAIWVGHSMGTQIVAEAAVQRPELVRALVLIAPTVDAAARTAPRQVWHMVRDLAGESPRVLAIGLWQYAKTSPAWFARKLRFMLAHHLEADHAPHRRTDPGAAGRARPGVPRTLDPAGRRVDPRGVVRPDPRPGARGGHQGRRARGGHDRGVRGRPRLRQPGDARGVRH